MADPDVQALTKLMEDQHKTVMEEISSLKLQIAPISKVYNSLQGFGGVLKWIFKTLIIPASIIVGIMESTKNIKIGW